MSLLYSVPALLKEPPAGWHSTSCPLAGSIAGKQKERITCLRRIRQPVPTWLPVHAQVQQLAWHRYDFISAGLALAAAFCGAVWAVACVALGHPAPPALTAAACAYIAGALYVAAR